jgi:hypothetical protein
MAAVFLKRASLQKKLPLLAHGFSLETQMALHGATEALVGEIVDAVGGLRIQSPEPLEASAGSSLESLKPLTDRILDRGIVTDIEMEVSLFLEGPPVTAVKGLAVA